MTVIERVNARALDARAAARTRPTSIVVDVSFISLTKVLPAVLGLRRAALRRLAMVKPQFEVGRERIGKGGVVRDPALRREALVGGRRRRAAGAAVMGFAPSGLPGPEGQPRDVRCGWPRAAAPAPYDSRRRSRRWSA